MFRWSLEASASQPPHTHTPLELGQQIASVLATNFLSASQASLWRASLLSGSQSFPFGSHPERCQHLALGAAGLSCPYQQVPSHLFRPPTGGLRQHKQNVRESLVWVE